MKRIIVFLFLLFSIFESKSQDFIDWGGTDPCETPNIVVDGTVIQYDGYKYNWGAHFTLFTYNCVWTSCGVVAGFSPNVTIDNYDLPGCSWSNYYNTTYFTQQCNSTAGVNQPPFYVRAYVITTAGIFYSNAAIISVSGTIPVVATTSVSSVGTSTAYSGGSISAGSSIAAKGIVWGFDSSINIGNYVGITNNGTGTGSWSSYLSGLNEGTNYFVKAYATNPFGTGYGDAVLFTTQQSVTQPIVSTTNISSIASTTAYSGGTVNYSGGGSVIEYGVCYDVNPSPDYNDSKTNDGSGVGSFTSSMTGLSPNTTYYVRAYAKASGVVNGFTVMAVGYGQELSFTTTSSGNIPTVLTASVYESQVQRDYPYEYESLYNLTYGGNITNNGGSAVSDRGVVYSNSNTIPIIGGSGVTKTAIGSGSGSFSSSVYAYLFTPGTTYYFRAYATNSTGTAYGDVSSIYVCKVPTVSSQSLITSYVYNGVNIDFYKSQTDAENACYNHHYNLSLVGSSGGFDVYYTSFTSGNIAYASSTNSLCNKWTTGWALTSDWSNIVHIVDGVIESIIPCPPFDPNTLIIGDSYGGGIVGYVLQSSDPGYDLAQKHGIIICSSDLGQAQWAEANNYTSATGIAIGDGTANTNAITSYYPSNQNIAAWICKNLVYGGFDDWVLPSKNEIEKLYTIYASGSLTQYFGTDYYWSSTESAASYAYSVSFATGVTSTITKGTSDRVVAIRYF